MITVSHFVGDAEYPLALPGVMIEELQRKTGSGIGALMSRFASQAFSFNDLRETVRCSLIGGGMKPATADQLAATYIDERPIDDAVQIAFAVLNARFFGTGTEELVPIADEPKPASTTTERVIEAFAQDELRQGGADV